jgi:hypothetical protein
MPEPTDEQKLAAHIADARQHIEELESAFDCALHIMKGGDHQVQWPATNAALDGARELLDHLEHRDPHKLQKQLYEWQAHRDRLYEKLIRISNMIFTGSTDEDNMHTCIGLFMGLDSYWEQMAERVEYLVKEAASE